MSAPREQRRKPLPAPLLVLGGIVSVQFGGALAAGLIAQIGALPAAWLRLLLAAVMLALIARPSLRGHSRRAWVTVIGFGIALAAMNAAFYGSLAHVPIGVAVTVEFLGPLTLAAVLSRRASDALAVLFAAAGVALASGALGSLTQLNQTGIGLALVAGACWAAYIVLSGRTGAEFADLDGLALAMLVACVVLTPVGVGTLHSVTWPIAGMAAVVAVLSSVVPYSLELVALRRLSATVFGILLALEPAVAAVAGWLVLRQSLSLTQLIGIAFVVVASGVVLGGGRRHRVTVEEIEPLISG